MEPHPNRREHREGATEQVLPGPLVRQSVRQLLVQQLRLVVFKAVKHSPADSAGRSVGTIRGWAYTASMCGRTTNIAPT